MNSCCMHVPNPLADVRRAQTGWCSTSCTWKRATPSFGTCRRQVQQHRYASINRSLLPCNRSLLTLPHTSTDQPKLARAARGRFCHVDFACPPPRKARPGVCMCVRVCVCVCAYVRTLHTHTGKQESEDLTCAHTENKKNYVLTRIRAHPMYTHTHTHAHIHTRVSPCTDLV